MAKFSLAHPLNLPGPVFVDTTCIDCGTCFHIAPHIFDEKSDKSVVIGQPDTGEEWSQAKRAIVSCPTNSIGVHKAPDAFKEADTDLPFKIQDNIYYCGYAAESSFGATSYFIERPEGNILVDSPRFHPHLVKELESRGGVSLMVLTHQDDVADHQKFRDHFQLRRLIHKDELSSGTKNCEIIWKDSEDLCMDKDLRFILVPGHTRGHLTFLYQNKYLFTGDHIFVNQERHELSSSRGVCWYSWPEQVKSTEKLLNYNFQWVLPGHGGWGDFGDSAHDKLQELVKRMKTK